MRIFNALILSVSIFFSVPSYPKDMAAILADDYVNYERNIHFLRGKDGEIMPSKEISIGVYDAIKTCEDKLLGADKSETQTIFSLFRDRHKFKVFVGKKNILVIIEDEESIGGEYVCFVAIKSGDVIHIGP